MQKVRLGQGTEAEEAYLYGHWKGLEKVDDGLLPNDALEVGLLALRALVLPLNGDMGPDLEGIIQLISGCYLQGEGTHCSA